MTQKTQNANVATAEELNREFRHYRQYGVVFAVNAGRITVTKFVPLALRAHGFAPLPGEGWYRGTDSKKVYPLSRDVPDDQWRWEAAEQRR